MKSTRKKKLLNILMAAVIAAIIFTGVMLVGSIHGWFSEDGLITITDKLGNANIERSGIAYSLNDSTELKDGDKVMTLGSSKAKLAIKDVGSITLGEDTEVTVISAKKDAIIVEVLSGEVFANIETQKSTEFSFSVDERTITTVNAVFSLSAPSGSQNVYVYSGVVNFDAQNISGETTAQAGQAAALLGEKGETVCSLSTLNAAALNSFLIEQIKSANDTAVLIFEDEELDELIAARHKELEQIEAERKAHEEELLAQGGNVEIPVAATETQDEDPQEESSTGGTSEVSVAGSSSGGESKPKDTPKPDPTPEPTKAPDIHTCTISIRCDTILDNMENLVEGKAQYVPANGGILATSSVQFYDGETVFDVLKRTCKAAGIQIEYSYFPIYESYYIEGINHLYEFDCGAESGWMYKVNGWFPNYGCSAYTLEDDDNIVWCYTCNGLGEDVGGSVY